MWKITKEFLANYYTPDDILMFECIWPKERVEEGIERGIIRRPKATPENPNPRAFTVPTDNDHRKFLKLSEVTDEVLNHYKKLNEMGWGIYFGIGPRITKETRDGTAKNVKHFTYLVADFDAKDYFDEEELAKCDLDFIAKQLEGFPIPSYIVKTGGGYHCYWPLDKPINPLEWQALQKRLNLTLGADQNTNKISGVLRLPGYVNTKQKDNLRDVIFLTEESSCVKCFPLKNLESKILPGDKWQSSAANKATIGKGYSRASLYSWPPFNITKEFTERKIHFCKRRSKSVPPGGRLKSVPL